MPNPLIVISGYEGEDADLNGTYELDEKFMQGLPLDVFTEMWAALNSLAKRDMLRMVRPAAGWDPNGSPVLD